MFLIKPSYEILQCPDGKEVLKLLEVAGRTCWKTEDKINEDSAPKFIKMVLSKNHQSVIEHQSITIRFIVDRGFLAEITRHRLASFSVESTRYVASVKPPVTEIVTTDDVINAYNNGYSMKRISKKSNNSYTESQVNNILNKANIKRRNLGSTGIIYHDFFDYINTHEKAYLLGIIMADGCVRTTHNSLQITQHKNISWYLYAMIKKFIRPNIKYIKDRDCYNFTVISKPIVDTLLDKGIIPRKSIEFTQDCADKLWKSIPDEFKISFLRGYLDGDGHIRFFKQKESSSTYSVNMGWSGPIFLLNHIKKWIENNFHYNINITKTDSKFLYRLVISKSEIGLNFCKELLKDFVFPYGNPIKTPRMAEHINYSLSKFASWGDENFKVIIPEFLKCDTNSWIWMEAMDKSEEAYTKLIDLGWQPQQARSVLPNSLKTEIVMTANLREFRHILELRTSSAAHPQMVEIMRPLLLDLRNRIPVIFDNIGTL